MSMLRVRLESYWCELKLISVLCNININTEINNRGKGLYKLNRNTRWICSFKYQQSKIKI